MVDYAYRLNRDQDLPFWTLLQLNPNSGRKIGWCNLQVAGCRLHVVCLWCTLLIQQPVIMANINIVTTNGEHIPVHVLVIDQIDTLLQNNFRQQVQTIPHLKGIQLAHPVTSDENFEILLLIGEDQYWDIVKDMVIRGQGPTAVESKLGYLISGPLQIKCMVNRTDTVVNLLQTLSCTSVAERDLEHFWFLESVGISPTAEMDDQESFLQHFQSCSNTRMSDGSYSAKFPWKEDCPALPSNYVSYARCTRAMIHRVAQTPSFLRSYGEIIKEHEKPGFIEMG